jgi:hypothetical protein
VEALVKIGRRTFFVPIPKVSGFDLLNENLTAGCVARLNKLAGDGALLADLDALRPLPAVPFDACEQRAGHVSSMSLVRYRPERSLRILRSLERSALLPLATTPCRSPTPTR